MKNIRPVSVAPHVPGLAPISFRVFCGLASSSSLLGSLTTEELEFLYEHGKVDRFLLDDHIIREGTIGRSIFLLLSGRAGAYFKDRFGNPCFLAKYRPGDFFGEIAYFTDGVRNASIAATAPADVLVMGEKLVDQLVKKHPRIHNILYHAFEQRMTALNEVRKEHANRLRRFTRKPVLGQASVNLSPATTGGEPQFGVLKNLCEGGCKVEMDGDVFLQHMEGVTKRAVPVSLHLEGLEVTVKVTGRVKWYQQAVGMDVIGYRYRFGLEFVEVPDTAKKILKNYLRSQGGR